MDTNEIMSIYYQQAEILKKLGNIAIYKPVKLKDLDLNRAETLKGYRDAKTCGREGNLIDFFCWLSSFYIANTLVKIDINSFKNPDVVPQFFRILFGPFKDTAGHNIINAIRLYIKDKNCLRDIMIAIKPENMTESDVNELIKLFLQYFNENIKISVDIQ